MPALQEFLDTYPEPRQIREDLKAMHAPKTAKHAPAPTRKQDGAKPTPALPAPKVDRTKAETATEVFKRRMEVAGKQHSVRKLADRILADFRTLETELSKAATRKNLSPDDRTRLLEALDDIDSSANNCRKSLKS